MQLSKIGLINWGKYRLWAFANAVWKRRTRKQWMQHGYTVELAEGGVLHFRTIRDMSEALTILYGRCVSRSNVHRSLHNGGVIKTINAKVTYRKEVTK